MKKTYIAPAVSVHKLNIESSLLGPSQFRRTDFGNYRFKESPYELNPELGPDESYSIDLIDGDDWETL